MGCDVASCGLENRLCHPTMTWLTGGLQGVPSGILRVRGPSELQEGERPVQGRSGGIVADAGCRTPESVAEGQRDQGSAGGESEFESCRSPRPAELQGR